MQWRWFQDGRFFPARLTLFLPTESLLPDAGAFFLLLWDGFFCAIAAKLVRSKFVV
jgi:hypothetical protein